MGTSPGAPASHLVSRWSLSCVLGCLGLRGPFAIIARPRMAISATHSVGVALHSVWLLTVCIQLYLVILLYPL